MKPPKCHTEPEEGRQKQRKETPQTSRSKKVLTSRKTKNTLIGSKDKYSAFGEANTLYYGWPVYFDAEVQTDLTGSEIKVSLMASS